jgi:hypothetical protein
MSLARPSTCKIRNAVAKLDSSVARFQLAQRRYRDARARGQGVLGHPPPRSGAGQPFAERAELTSGTRKDRGLLLRHAKSNSC